MSDDRESQVRGALAKGFVALVAIAVAIGLGTFVMVRALGLDGDDSGSAVAGAPSSSEPLPTTALPVPEESPTSSEGASESPSEEAEGRIRLDVSPRQVGPSQRINMTGSYRGGDNVQLQVQRFEGGTWTQFPVDAQVTAGTFQTWIQTGRTGEQRFRVFDPQSEVASNEVTVTVG